jgi:hypothetical protein
MKRKDEMLVVVAAGYFSLSGLPLKQLADLVTDHSIQHAGSEF